MQMPGRGLLAAGVAFLGIECAAAADTYAPWLTQIGVTEPVASAGRWGRNQLLGVVDTGIAARNRAFASGQVSNVRSRCAAVTFHCPSGAADDNGHGTAVAAIAAANRPMPFATAFGGYTVRAGALIGVAPSANLLAEKVLNAQGAGTPADVANGIRRAADAGASVINVSISYAATPELVAAINHAAGRGAFIVWAGGNDGAVLAAGASTTGLTPAALRRLLFVGSVNARNAISSFSNTPGAAHGARWLMAPGEAIVAPYTPAGPSALAYWSGTSMAAPLVSGSLLLLESAWPILRTNGTAADLLLATATDLGATGTDSTYGSGLVNLEHAFRPYGALTVRQANGRTVNVSSLTGSMISGGALGSLGRVRTRLASYTAFDGFSRNFAVDLSGLIRSPSARAQLRPLPITARAAPARMRFADGMHAEFAEEAEPAGVFALTPGSPLFSLGKALDGSSRLAFSWSASGHDAPPGGNGITPAASAFGLGMTRDVGSVLSFGVTIAALNESNGFLGSTYGPGSPLALGASNATRSVGWSAGLRLDAKSTLVFEAGFAATQGSAGSGLFAGTTDVESRYWGLSFSRRDVLDAGDSLVVSLRQPLRVARGQAGLVTQTVDELGYAHPGTEWLSLEPEGRELAYGLCYRRPVAKRQTITFQAGYRRDLFHMPGLNDASVGVAWAMRF
ncbi:MAG: S8 family peptidase [Betaproteobacteria bacterium]